ncbi:MAG: hypothetical protein AAFQ89_17715 [Cyanobacteria bacterium J06626_18]
MKKLDFKTEVHEGWVVQVYGGNRRLLCVLESSHGWIFLLGCSLGALLTVLLVNLANYSPSTEPTETTSPPALVPPSLQVD